MAVFREIGCGMEHPRAAEIVANARLAEELGFGTFWVPEDYFFRGAFAMASAAAIATARVNIGIGVLNPYTRHPALTAMEFAALDELSGGRAILGVGAGLRDWIEGRLGIPYTRSTSAMRECIAICRAIIRGETVTMKGRVFNVDGIRLSFKPHRTEIPISLGVLGPKNLELAGEAADSVLLSVMTSPKYIRYAMEHVDRALKKSGRERKDFGVGAYLLSCISEDERAARNAMKPFLAMLIALMTPQPETPILATAGLEPDFIRAVGAKVMRQEDASNMIEEWMIDAFTIAGSPERCIDNLKQFAAAGLTAPVFFEVPGIAPDKMMRDVNRHLMPHLL